ncbi:hypothetical protein L1887_46816 [Cichorium endivia]|nr:hypothetical protein L1887_46816 [Cichorium endivia]
MMVSTERSGFCASEVSLGLGVDGDEPVSHVSVLETLDGAVDALLGHGHLLDDRLDGVSGSKEEHLLVHLTRGDEGALDLELLSDDGHVGEDKVVRVDRERDDGCVLLEHLEVGFPVGLCAGGDHEKVDRLDALELGVVLGRDEFVRAQLDRLVLLVLGAGEDDDVAAHLVEELDGEVTETTDADHADAVVRLDACVVHRTEHGRTTALQRRSMLELETVGDLVAKLLGDDEAVTERRLVEVGVAVHLVLVAVGVAALFAELAGAARVVVVAPADAVALLEVLDIGADLRDDADALVADDHVLLEVVDVGEAEARVGDVDDHIARVDGAVGALRLDDLAGRRALENSAEVDGGHGAKIQYVGGWMDGMGRTASSGWFICTLFCPCQVGRCQVGRGLRVQEENLPDRRPDSIADRPRKKRRARQGDSDR